MRIASVTPTPLCGISRCSISFTSTPAAVPGGPMTKTTPGNLSWSLLPCATVATAISALLPQLRRDRVEVPQAELAALVSTTKRAPLIDASKVEDEADVRPTPRALPGRAGAGRNAGHTTRDRHRRTLRRNSGRIMYVHYATFSFPAHTRAEKSRNQRLPPRRRFRLFSALRAGT